MADKDQERVQWNKLTNEKDKLSAVIALIQEKYGTAASKTQKSKRLSAK